MRPDLPSGTVTFLFSDVEGSTKLLNELGAEAYADALAGHRRLVREACISEGGVEVDTQGDAFFFAFPTAPGALAAASAFTQRLSSGPIRVRVGVHTGTPVVADEGYVGQDVHRAARIAASGHGGQVLVSSSAAALVECDLRDLGEHRLKDLVSAERLFQLGDGEFPPLRTLDATNLPVVSIPLVGRERELEELVGLLSNGTRLLTLTGPGGTGKTRLALQVAAELAGTLRDGVYWLPLAGLSDHELVPSEVALTIGAPDDLAGFLRGRELLVLLDNFEHLLEAAPRVSALLASSSGLRLLVTSRTRLRVSGEREYGLEPLPDVDAATLFVQRAGEIGRELTADATVAEICRRLDGLPLAIELAAARTKLLAPERLLERFGSVLPLLTGGTRDAPERQRTLRATIEWSYDLLDPADQALFARLAVFAGAFPIAAAEEVAGAELDHLDALVEANLVKPIGDDRFLMLETIREYAAEKLAESEEAEEIRRRHALFFADLAENAYAYRFDAEAEWSERLALDHDDLRSALDWLESNDPARALALSGALGWFWLSHGHLAEGRDRLARLIAAAADESATAARALTAAGALTGRGGDAEAGRALLQRGVECWSALDDRSELAAALDALGWLLVYDAGNDRASLQAFEDSLKLYQELGDASGETRALVGTCQVLVALGDVVRAEALSHELLERAADDPRTRHFAHHFLADCALIRGDTVEAETRYRQSLKAAILLGDVFEASFEVQGVAMAAAGNGDHHLALRLAGAVEMLWESLGTSFAVSFWDALLDRYLGAARAELGETADTAWTDGRGLSFEDAVELALGNTATDS